LQKLKTQVQDASGFGTRITTGPNKLKQKMAEEKGSEHNVLIRR